MIKPYGFWISPFGEIHTILNDFGHKKFIERLFETTFQTDEDATNYTLNNGWIRIVNGSTSFMVDYRYIMNSEQLKAIKLIDDQLQVDGFFHKDYILSYGMDYYFFDNIKKLINRIKERSC